MGYAGATRVAMTVASARAGRGEVFEELEGFNL